MKENDRFQRAVRNLAKYLRWNHILTGILLGIIVFSCYKIVSYKMDDVQNQAVIRLTQSLITSVPIATEQPTSTDVVSPTYSPAYPTWLHKDIKENLYPVQPTPAPTPKMVPADPLQPKLDFANLLEVNPDTVGWLKIAGTNIDYPVVQAKDNDYYLRRNFMRKKNVNGSVFMDYRNRLDEMERNTVLYGHNMKNRSMFADIVYYESKYFFNEHPIIEFETLNFQGRWQVFSAYYTDPNTDYIRTTFRDDSDFISFLDTIKQHSMYDTGVTVDELDTILTLSTCSVSDEEGRFTVHAKWIKPTK